MRKILRAIDRTNDRAAAVASWLVALLVAAILFEVISRYVFNAPTSWGLGSFRMLGGGIVALGWAYAQRLDSHIRVDILYIRFPHRARAVINLIGSAAFFFPIFGYFIMTTAVSVWGDLLDGQLFAVSTGGAPTLALPYQMVILIGLSLFYLQFAAHFVRDLYTLAGSSAS